MIGDLRKLGVIIDNVEILTQILSNLCEEYENISENLEDELYDDINILTIKIFWDKMSSKYDKMTARYNQNKGK